MKKFTAIFIAAVLMVFSSITVFAAGINSAEQAVLDELNSSVTMQGNEMVIPASYINQAESYFNTIDMTDAESKSIISIIKEGKAFLENSGVANIMDLSFDQKQQLLAYGREAVGVIGMTMSWDKSTKQLSIIAPDGTVAFTATPSLTTAGSTSGGSSTTGGIVDDSVIKTTGLGFDLATVAAFATVGILFVGFAGLFLAKTKKERA